MRISAEAPEMANEVAAIMEQAIFINCMALSPVFVVFRPHHFRPSRLTLQAFYG
jgi:hypothetical protein